LFGSNFDRVRRRWSDVPTARDNDGLASSNVNLIAPNTAGCNNNDDILL
jgi:hypothetical protein